MKIDRMTKISLWLIVLFLSIIAFRPILTPPPVLAQTGLQGIQMTPAPQGALSFFDSRTGDIWVYSTEGAPVWHMKIAKLGQPLTK